MEKQWEYQSSQTCVIYASFLLFVFFLNLVSDAV